MSRFPLLACSALVAVSLALATPLPVFAQDTSVVTQDQALIWTHVERFGVLIPVPEGAPVTDDVDTPTDRNFAVNTTDGSSPGIRVGIMVMTPANLAELPAAPGADGFVGFLSQIGPIPVEPTGVVVQLGARALYAYGGAGTRATQEGVEIDARMLYLVAHDVDAEGQGLMLGFYAQALGAEAAAQAEAEFVSRLALAPAAEAAVAPETAPEASAAAAGLPPLVLIDGLATLALTPDDVIVRTDRDDTGVGLRLTNGQGQLLWLVAHAPDPALVDSLRRLVDRVDSVTEGFAGGQPVWRVQGVTGHPPLGRRTDMEFPVTLVVPQFCLADSSGIAVAVVTDPGFDEATQALLAGLTFTRPDGAEFCAALAAFPEALTAPPEPAAIQPEPVQPPVTEPVLPALTPPPSVGSGADAPIGKLPMTANAPMAPPPQAPVVAPLSMLPQIPGFTDEIALWADAVGRNQPEGFWTYLKAYPNGQFVQLAQVMLTNRAQFFVPQPVPPPAPPPAPAQTK